MNDKSSISYGTLEEDDGAVGVGGGCGAFVNGMQQEMSE